MLSPSSAGESTATIIDRVRIGSRIDTNAAQDRSVLGEAIHACIAADLIAAEAGLPAGGTPGVIESFRMSDGVSTAASKVPAPTYPALLQTRLAAGVSWDEVA